VIKISRNIDERNSHAFKCDVTNLDNIQDITKRIISKFGRIDVLINCAGLMKYNELIEAKEDDFDQSFKVNVKGTFLMCREILPHMRHQRGGYIINISSIRGITAAPEKGIYSATKFAVRALTETIQLENREFNIKATSICPGIIWTESTRRKLELEGLNKNDVITTEDIVKTVGYLLSLSSKAFVGEIIIGGRRYG